MGSPVLWSEEKKKKTSCHKVMTSSGSRNQHGLAELVSHDTVRSNQILLAHAISCLTAVSSDVVREAGKGDKTLCQNSPTDHLVCVTEGENSVHILHCLFTYFDGMNSNHLYKI